MKCVISDCDKLAIKRVKVQVQHMFRKTWQSWKLCKDCTQMATIDKFRQSHGLKFRYGWHVIYKIEPKRRQVIAIGEITELLQDLIY